MSAGRPAADWRDDSAYDWLGACDRHSFAWEWLRRMPAYQAAWLASDRSQAVAARFGLLRLAPFDCDARAARPLWCAAADPYVLAAKARPSSGAGGFDVSAMACATVLVTSDAEHWLFADGTSQLRLDVVQGTLRRGPVRLTIQLGLPVEVPLAAVQRRVAALGRKALAPGLFPAERKAVRWAQVLRVHDALVEAAPQRAIADVLFGIGEVERWRVTAPSWRRRVQRLVDAARRAAAADPCDWLRGRFP